MAAGPNRAPRRVRAPGGLDGHVSLLIRSPPAEEACVSAVEAEGVDLVDQVTLGDAADAGVAWGLADRRERAGDDDHGDADAGGRERGVLIRFPEPPGPGRCFRSETTTRHLFRKGKS